MFYIYENEQFTTLNCILFFRFNLLSYINFQWRLLLLLCTEIGNRCTHTIILVGYIVLNSSNIPYNYDNSSPFFIKLSFTYTFQLNLEFMWDENRRIDQTFDHLKAKMINCLYEMWISARSLKIISIFFFFQYFDELKIELNAEDYYLK